MQDLVLCAAMNSEAKVCDWALKNLPPSLRKRILILRTGVGPKSASKSLRKYLSHASPKPKLIISTGIAGCLNSDKNIGQVYQANRIVDSDGTLYRSTPRLYFKDELPLCSISSHSTVLHVGDQAESSSGHTRLVDMESAAISDVANEFKIDFAIFRSISDRPEDPLPSFVIDWFSRHKNPIKKAWVLQGSFRKSYGKMPTFFKNFIHSHWGLYSFWSQNAEKLLSHL